MNTPKLTVEQRLQRVINKRDRQVFDLKKSRDHWMKRAMIAERKLTKDAT